MLQLCRGQVRAAAWAALLMQPLKNNNNNKTCVKKLKFVFAHQMGEHCIYLRLTAEALKEFATDTIVPH